MIFWTSITQQNLYTMYILFKSCDRSSIKIFKKASDIKPINKNKNNFNYNKITVDPVDPYKKYTKNRFTILCLILYINRLTIQKILWMSSIRICVQ